MSAPSAGATGLAGLAELCQALAATTSRQRKAQLTAAHLATLSAAELPLGARYLAAQVFASSDARRLQLGPAQLQQVLAERSGTAVEDVRAMTVQLGDVAAVAEALAPATATTTTTTAAAAAAAESLSLLQLRALFAALAADARPAARRARLGDAIAALPGPQRRVLLGIILGELRTGLKQGVLEAAIAQAFAAQLPAVQRAHMLTGDLGETAARARAGTLEQAQLHLFAPLHFMLATAIESAPAALAQLPRPCVVQDKFDGIRVQAHVGRRPEPAAGATDAEGGLGEAAALRGLPATAPDGTPMQVALFSRTLEDITPSFAELVPALAGLVPPHRSLVLDGELLPVRGGAALPFSALQPRLGRRGNTERWAAEVPVALCAFDLLAEDGHVLLDAPWSQRAARLSALPLVAQGEAGPLRQARSDWADTQADLDAFFAAARARGHEGLVVKSAESAYAAGRRGRTWLKMKLPAGTLDVVVVRAEVGHGRRRHWLSDYTLAVRRSEADPTLCVIGRAYSGLKDAEIAELTTWFEAHTLETLAHGKVRVVQPEVVLEVTFDQIQASSRAASGYAMRFPRIVRRRPDKPVHEIDTLEAVAALARTSSAHTG